ncbi:hypothetical protein EYZ11_009909 [Aspergillus tanneri]|uniref:Capsule polysaccharide biosynthesis protein n=1 Tax=Aspergillus tanneri TaxID=1220188 RepID=A0A4S3J6W2_9EURO|nr:uncharacterized protein ATNIH1004_000784 [Aspergillus tanneri]KAA8651886.1 hypothetical protein ATNIH1004_000784 [Aspergillus tanneri]THC90630.1 hypothetical protein EYZ11_009909 [Aspergillus tanneri]
MGFPGSVRLDSIYELLSSLLPVFSWKTLALVLALINLKNLPFVWHLRILHHLVSNIRWKPEYPHFPKGHPIVSHTGKPTHPVFVPYGITSRAPILETDYNFHKSNSTYFSDLDVARTALATRLYSPGSSIVSKELDAEFLAASRREGKPAPPRKSIYIALGSVYCAFKREIKPFERYEIESKLIAWDQKWMYILTFFLRPAPRKGGKRTLFATALSKYVIKKGRLTVPPERVMRASGFLPPRPEGSDAATSTEMPGTSGAGTPASEGITAMASVDGSLVREVLKLEDESTARDTLEAERKANADSWDATEWPWERIEQERLRGLKVVEGYASMDAILLDEWEQ